MDKLFLSTKELSILFSRHERTIQRWIEKAQPRTKNGKYYAPDLFLYFENSIARKNDKSKEELELELKRVKLEKERFTLEKERGEYVKRDDVELEWAQRVSEIKSGLLALEFRLSTQLANKKRSLPKTREIIKKEILDLLWSYVRKGKYIPKINENLPLDKQEEITFEFFQKLSEIPCDNPKLEIKCPKKKTKREKK
ncbi:hypothetical protein SAMN06269117_11442 [Balnearium lithotrophicum]|uniref:Phage DNA packaging protein, Nu1 subunit of terminase n=1 Tax=Balnearium lithotrophicum TaxID=223788 RepID=A0A521CPS4_9BACT|nr:hypothetical protein [Balnearium lithotrophicum]SMO61423.1 hypothetical protein SAMN06269117_11442 [Balnearium lithotrophicum]